MDEGDLPLVVPIAAFSDYFQCSICMCNMTECTITVCGHRYCDKCIREWVGRQHKCPCCNHLLNETQLIKDHQFDSLISTMDEEKEKAESKYFDSLISAAASSDNVERNMTSVELVLKKHLKQGLLEHERYFQSLKKSFQNKLTLIEQTTDKAILELQTHGLSEQEILMQTQDLSSTLERQKADLSEEMATCASLVAEAYDKYLEKHVPNLDVLPVKITISLPQKNIKIDNITLQPMSTMKDVRDVVESNMIKRHNPVHLWELDVRCFLFGPFAKCTECEMEKIIDDYDTNGLLIPDVQLLADACPLGLQYGMKPGSIIVIVGTIILESDLPKRCFVETYKPGDKSQRVDYFSCSDCGFKWVCRSCMEVCHQGHQIAPYIMQHQPNWACCYCPKKKKCKIQPSDSTR